MNLKTAPTSYLQKYMKFEFFFRVINTHIVLIEQTLIMCSRAYLMSVFRLMCLN